MLKEALGGNCRTTLVANIMLEDDHSEETLSTLRFAARMQSVANVAVANKHEEISAADALRQSQAKVAELKRELAMHDQLANRSAVSYEPMGAQQKLELRRQVQAYLSREVDELDILSLRQVRETFEQFRVLYDEQARALDKRDRQRDAARAEVETMALVPAAAMDDDGGMTGRRPTAAARRGDDCRRPIGRGARLLVRRGAARQPPDGRGDAAGALPRAAARGRRRRRRHGGGGAAGATQPAAAARRRGRRSKRSSKRRGSSSRRCSARTTRRCARQRRACAASPSR